MQGLFFALDLVLFFLSTRVIVPDALNALNAPTGHKGIRASVTMVRERVTI